MFNFNQTSRPVIYTVGWLFSVFFIPGILQAEEATKPAAILKGTPAVSTEAIQNHINFLADSEQQGRSQAGKKAVRTYITEWFEEYKVQPLFDGEYLQPVPDLRDDTEQFIVGQNIGGFIAGTDPTLKDEWIIVNAHYDHLGVRGGKTYPGADDNASGVSMLLELSKHFSEHPTRRPIAFVAFDLEEYMLWGSRWFIAHTPMEVEQIRLCITADMISRSLGGYESPTVFILGSEHSPELQTALNEVDMPEDLSMARLGIDIIGTRSDYGPFRDEQIPFLFFSTGEHPDYHQPTDTAESINAEKCARVSTLIRNTVERMANADEPPTWTDDTPPNLVEVQAIFDVTNYLLEDEDAKLSTTQRFLVSQIRSKTKYMLKEERISESERKLLVRSTQFMMLSVF